MPLMVALGTKLEWCAGRGSGGYLGNPDLEDIVALIDGRAEICDEVTQPDADRRRFPD